MTTGRGKVFLPERTNNTKKDLVEKRKAAGHYLFSFAFENQIEPGYVTEKIFDALYAGVVPVYLGDARSAKRLLPDPTAAIFISDFPDIYAVSKYLKLLMSNATAYNRHRAWRQKFDHKKYVENHPILQHSWYCSVCYWAKNKALSIEGVSSRKQDFKCSGTHKSMGARVADGKNVTSQARKVKSSSPQKLLKIPSGPKKTDSVKNGLFRQRHHKMLRKDQSQQRNHLNYVQHVTFRHPSATQEVNKTTVH